MPEAGYLPIPGKLARKGVKDMVRLSDARMSGTAYGTVVLHIAPDAAAGGPLAKVCNGDRIRLSVAERKLDLLVEPAELAGRPAPVPPDTDARLSPPLPPGNPPGRPRLRLRLSAPASYAELDCDAAAIMKRKLQRHLASFETRADARSSG